MSDARYGVPQPTTETFTPSRRVTVPAIFTPTVKIGLIVPGSNDQVTQAAPLSDPVTVQLESRFVVYYHAAPPIYRVIVQGGTNQGFQIQPVPVETVGVPASKTIRFTAVTVPGKPVIARGKEPVNAEQTFRLSRTVKGYPSAVVAGTARHRTLMGVGQ